jgi:quercetin dioxygenase-like cupin family protein
MRKALAVTVGVIVLCAIGTLVFAQRQQTNPALVRQLLSDGSTHGSRPHETVTVAADEPIPNLPGKRLVSHIVDYPAGGRSAPHRHARSAFIYAYVLSGEIRSQVDGEPARVYRVGEAWFESPGAHHRVSENASDTKPARLLAVLIVDAADKQLVIPDPQ